MHPSFLSPDQRQNTKLTIHFSMDTYKHSQASPRHLAVSQLLLLSLFHHARRNHVHFFSQDSCPSTCFFSSFAALSATYDICMNRTALEHLSPLSILPIVSLRSVFETFLQRGLHSPHIPAIEVSQGRLTDIDTGAGSQGVPPYRTSVHCQRLKMTFFWLEWGISQARCRADLYRRGQCFWWLTKVSIMAQRFDGWPRLTNRWQRISIND